MKGFIDKQFNNCQYIAGSCNTISIYNILTHIELVTFERKFDRHRVSPREGLVLSVGELCNFCGIVTHEFET